MPLRSPPIRRLSRQLSWSSDDSHAASPKQQEDNTLEPPILVYHSSAHSIVFRDQIRRATFQRSDSALSTGSTSSEYAIQHTKKSTSPPASPQREKSKLKEAPPVSPVSVKTTTNNNSGFQPRIQPFSPLELGPNEEFQPLLNETSLSETWTSAEQEVVERLQQQTAVVKTLKNSEWATFLQRFKNSQPNVRGRSKQHQDVMDSIFNSFVTSTSLLPSNGLKMRCYGSTIQYTTGVVFGLPTNFDNTAAEDKEVEKTETWAWPAGYAAKTEFNVDGHGKLINGRKEALVPISVMRQYNDDYLHKEEYIVAGKKVSDQSQIPYNEIYVRVGGKGRNVNGLNVATKEECTPSYETGVGLPIALFVRTATYGHLISMMRARARLMHVLGEDQMRGIPLLLMTPTLGVRVFTQELQTEFWKIASQSLNPFQNPHLSYKTTGSNIDEGFVQQKMNELVDLDESIREKLTPEELAHLAGGFGATDESVESLLTNVLKDDHKMNSEKKGETTEASHKLQDVVNEGLVYAIRSGDCHTARQLLILYSVVSARHSDIVDEDDKSESSDEKKVERQLIRSPDLSKTALMDLTTGITVPPPPPLDTDRLRSATNSDGLLAVLGAAQVLRVMKDGSAKRRVEEVITALEEWIEYGQHSLAFRIASWQNQRAAQGDLKINMEANSKFAAFAGKKAITNRKTFAQRLRDATRATDFTDARFLLAINEVLSSMHSPCLRLELLQYVLGLDNRYSVAHVSRSVELAATCLSMASNSD